MTSLLDRILPANLDAERFVLGSILLNDSVYPQVAGTVDHVATAEAHPASSTVGDSTEERRRVVDDNGKHLADASRMANFL